MKLLLDTCALLWMGLDASKLSERAQDALAGGDAELFVSAISAFEIGLKFARGKLELPGDPLDWFADALEEYGLQIGSWWRPRSAQAWSSSRRT